MNELCRAAIIVSGCSHCKINSNILIIEYNLSLSVYFVCLFVCLFVFDENAYLQVH